MGFRSLVLLSIVATAFSFASPSHAGTGGGASSSAASGAGGSSTSDSTCTVAEQEIAGTTCQACSPSACSSLGNGYSYVCTASSAQQVWCNGPVREQPSDKNVACAVTAPGQPGSGVASGVAAGVALALAIALGMRRRRRA